MFEVSPILGQAFTFCKNGMQAHLDLKQATHPELGADVQRLRLEVETNIPDLLHVKITDAGQKRYEVPESLLSKSAEQMKGKAMHLGCHMPIAAQCERLTLPPMLTS